MVNGLPSSLIIFSLLHIQSVSSPVLLFHGNGSKTFWIQLTNPSNMIITVPNTVYTIHSVQPTLGVHRAVILKSEERNENNFRFKIFISYIRRVFKPVFLLFSPSSLDAPLQTDKHTHIKAHRHLRNESTISLYICKRCNRNRIKSRMKLGGLLVWLYFAYCCGSLDCTTAL